MVDAVILVQLQKSCNSQYDPMMGGQEQSFRWNYPDQVLNGIISEQLNLPSCLQKKGSIKSNTRLHECCDVLRRYLYTLLESWIAP